LTRNACVAGSLDSRDTFDEAETAGDRRRDDEAVRLLAAGDEERPRLVAAAYELESGRSSDRRT
jgi:hypothetical protein